MPETAFRKGPLADQDYGLHRPGYSLLVDVGWVAICVKCLDETLTVVGIQRDGELYKLDLECQCGERETEYRPYIFRRVLKGQEQFA